MSSFDEALALVLKMEGGRVDDPRDPGGRTNFGITQRVYDAWRRSKGQATQDVYRIASDEVASIYRKQYADIVRFDELPAGVGYVVFDYGVNSGPSRAARALQVSAGCAADGVVGILTIHAAQSVNPTKLINSICDARLSFLRGLPTWVTFGKGCTNRVAFVRSSALKMAGAPKPVTPATNSVQMDAPPVERPVAPPHLLPPAPAKPKTTAAASAVVVAASTAAVAASGQTGHETALWIVAAIAAVAFAVVLGLHFFRKKG